MAFIPVTNNMRIAVEYTLNGQLVVNLYYAQRETPIVTANLTAAAQALVDWWTNVQSDNFTDDILLTRVVATDLTAQNGLQVINNPVSPIPGTLITNTAPNNVAIVTTHLTGAIGRSNRGRTYYAGVSATDVTDNFISTTRQTALLAAEVSLDNAIGSLGLTRRVVSLYTNGAPRVTGVSRQITGHKMNTRVDTQRRRLPGTGA